LIAFWLEKPGNSPMFVAVKRGAAKSSSDNGVGTAVAGMIIAAANVDPVKVDVNIFISP
jgi:hypothetical protein